MKISYDNCAICQSKLEMNVLESGNACNSILMSYTCPTKVKFFSESKKETVLNSHFLIRVFPEGDIVSLVLFPYLINHNLGGSVTAITKIYLDKGRKYITSLPLLDIDYSKPQDVIERLNKLMIFV